MGLSQCRVLCRPSTSTYSMRAWFGPELCQTICLDGPVEVRVLGFKIEASWVGRRLPTDHRSDAAPALACCCGCPMTPILLQLCRALHLDVLYRFRPLVLDRNGVEVRLHQHRVLARPSNNSRRLGACFSPRLCQTLHLVVVHSLRMLGWMVSAPGVERSQCRMQELETRTPYVVWCLV